MAGTNDEPEVKEVDRVEISPAGDDDEIVETEETDQESSPEETDETAEGDEPEEENRPDGLTQRQITTPPAAQADGEGGLKRLPDETDREFAQRLEITRLRGRLRGERSAELLDGQKPPAAAKKELAPEKAAILAKYKPEEISALREVFPALAEEMGFVRQDELAGNTYAEKAQESLDSFLDKHPEYTPENDPDGTLWNAFKAEYALFKQPSNPKDFAKIFERIHRDVFGIKPKGPLTKVNAQNEKVRVTSHAGASSASAAPKPAKTVAPSGLRLDMLKGFSDEEKAELLSDE